MFTNQSQAASELLFRRHIERYCSTCKAKGIAQAKCMEMGHTDHLLPDHQSAGALNQIRMMLPDDDDIATEIGGGIKKPVVVFRPPEIIKRLEDAKQSVINLPRGSILRFYTMHDPSGGGQQSKFAIVTVALVNLTLPQKGQQQQPKRVVVVIGLSCDPNTNEIDEQDCVMKHHLALRRLPYVREGAMSINLAEGNMGSTQAGRIYSYVNHAEFQPTFRVNEKLGKCGVWTSPLVKEEGVGMLLHELTEGNVVFASEIASSDPSRLPTTKTELIDQIKRYEKRPCKSERFGKTRFQYSGKTGPDQQDDLATSLLLLLFWISTLQKQAEYEARTGASYVSLPSF